MKSINSVLFLLFIPTLLSGQLNKTTLTFKDVTIECYKYKIEKDTLLIAYFDKSVRAIIKTYKSNLGKSKKDVTFDSIDNFVRKRFVGEKVTVRRTDTKAVLTDFKPGIESPSAIFGKAFDHFWIGAINYYSSLIENRQQTDTSYYQLANALIQYYGTSMPWINSRAISYLDSCISFNKNYYAAYVLKAKTHVQNAIWKGKLSADPNVDVIDPTELNKATATINFVLQKNRTREALAVYDEINKLKQKYTRYKYE